MTGKSHLAMNAAAAMAAVDCYVLMTGPDVPAMVSDFAEEARMFLLDSGDIPKPAFLVFAATLYFLGALLPDVDSPHSVLGRFIHIPITHRTWLHSVWFLLPAFLCGIKWRMVFWLGLGMFFHLFFDDFSRTGTDWFYPIKKKHRIKLYYTSKASEYIFDTVVVLAVAAWTGFLFYHRFWPMNPSL